MKKFSNSFLPTALVVSGLTGIFAVSSQAEITHAVRAETTTINSTGAISSFTVPTNVNSIRIVAKGAGGGRGGVLDAGKGGSVTFDVATSPGDELRFKVGGVGSSSSNSGANAGGWPDGGSGRSSSEFGGGGGGSTHVYKMNGSTEVLLAIAGGGGGGVDAGNAGKGGNPSTNSELGQPGPGNFRRSNSGGATITQGGAGGCVEDISLVAICGGNGSSMLGGNAHPTQGGGGGGGGYYGGGGGIFGIAGGGGSSWWDSSKISNQSQEAGANSGNGVVTLTYNVAEAIDDTYSLHWNPNGKIALSVSSISTGPAVSGTYALYDSATITGSPIASVSVTGNSESTEGTSLRTLNASSLFAVRFTSSNGSYLSQNWENLSLQCGTGSYNLTNGFIPCTLASRGYFVSNLRSTTETPCPSGFTTFATGASLCVSSSTQTPLISSPTEASSWKIGTLNPTLSYSLPETPLSNSVKMRWALSSDATTFRELNLSNTGGAVSLGAVDPLAPDSTLAQLNHVLGVSTKIANISSTGRMPHGLYTLTVSYQNVNAATVATASVGNIALREECSAGLTSTDGFTPCAAPVMNPPAAIPPTVTLPTETTPTATPKTSPTTAPNLTTSDCTVKKGRTISRTCLAKNAQIVLASTSKVSIIVLPSSSKICKVIGSSVKTLKSGTCSTTLKVTPKKGGAKIYKAKVVVTS
jgi:hypothetical protein